MEVDPVTGGMAYAVFLFSTTCHEAAHALAAFRLGDDTAYRGGQVTLDPTPHIRREPIGMVVLPILSYVVGGSMFGWASAPYNPEWAMRYPKRSAIMALAGPAANLGLVLASTVVMRAGMAAGCIELPYHFGWMKVVEAARGGPWPALAALMSLFFSMNLLLSVFNLLPFPPLDGASLPLLILPESAARSFMAMRSGFGLFGIVIAWRLFDQMFAPVWQFSIHLLLGSGSLF